MSDNSHYEMNYFIPGHTIINLRDRTLSKDLIAQTDWDLRYSLDRAVSNSVREGKFEKYVFYAEEITIVPIHDIDPKLYAVLKKNKHENVVFDEAIVTVLTEAMTKNNQRTGIWMTPEHYERWVKEGRTGHR